MSLSLRLLNWLSRNNLLYSVYSRASLSYAKGIEFRSFKSLIETKSSLKDQVLHREIGAQLQCSTNRRETTFGSRFEKSRTSPREILVSCGLYCVYWSSGPLGSHWNNLNQIQLSPSSLLFISGNVFFLDPLLKW